MGRHDELAGGVNDTPAATGFALHRGASFDKIARLIEVVGNCDFSALVNIAPGITLENPGTTREKIALFFKLRSDHGLTLLVHEAPELAPMDSIVRTGARFADCPGKDVGGGGQEQCTQRDPGPPCPHGSKRTRTRRLRPAAPWSRPARQAEPPA